MSLENPRRRRLPDERKSITHRFEVGGYHGYVTAGMYDDGTLGEILIVMAKEGSIIRGLLNTVAILTSIALQYGVPLETLADKFIGIPFFPDGITSNPDIKKAKSVVDYIFRWLQMKFLPDQVVVEINEN